MMLNHSKPGNHGDLRKEKSKNSCRGNAKRKFVQLDKDY